MEAQRRKTTMFWQLVFSNGVTKNKHDCVSFQNLFKQIFEVNKILLIFMS